MVTSTRWLSGDQQHAWRAFVLGSTLLMDQLDDELRSAHEISASEYEIMVRLSESPGRQMRMARLADSVAHSRSRITHTVSRLERAGLVQRCESPDDGRGVLAALTDKGFAHLQDAAHTHVTGVRAHLVDLVSDEDFAALGRVMDAVADRLIAGREEMEIR